MAILKNMSRDLFAWISPQKTHESHGAKRKASEDLPDLVVAKRRALSATKETTTGIVSYHRRSGDSGTIPWADAPLSSPTIYRSIEDQMAATALIEDAEMEDAGDEGAIDTLSEQDDSGLIDEDGSQTENDEESASDTHKIAVEMQTSFVSRTESGTGHDDDEEGEEEVEKIHDANQGTHVVDLDNDSEAALEAATRRLELDRDEKAQEQKAGAFEMLNEGWHRETVELYMLLDRRTIEPLMPIGWRSDFPLFPWSIWTYDYAEAFLGGTRPDQDYVVIKATRDLLKLPAHIRNQLRIKAWHGRRAEAMVVKYCEDYMKLIYKDSKLFVPLKLKKLWSLICYAPGDDKTPTDALETLILTRLRKRAKKVLESLRVETWDGRFGNHDTSNHFPHKGQTYLIEPPTLYGIVAKKALIAIVAYEPLSPRDALRTIAFFPMSNASADVWNAVALAIIMIQCRNKLLEIKAAIPEDLDALELPDSDEDA